VPRPTGRSRRARRVLALGAAGLLLAGCAGFGANAVINGWPIGDEETCPSPNLPLGAQAPEHWDCQAALSQWLTTATDAFNERSPAHAAYVRVTLHREGALRDAAGNQVLMTRSGGCCHVVVFELADGSVHALGIGHVGIDTANLTIVDEGP
jgi:hypothetical protein